LGNSGNQGIQCCVASAVFHQTRLPGGGTPNIPKADVSDDISQDLPYSSPPKSDQGKAGSIGRKFRAVFNASRQLNLVARPKVCDGRKGSIRATKGEAIDIVSCVTLTQHKAIVA
jgi:hypothetical protein